MPYKTKEEKLANAARYRAENPIKVRDAVRKAVAARKQSGKHPDYIRDRNFKRRYGLSTEQVGKLIQNQQGLCALCGQPFGDRRSKRPAVDHDHQTKIVRGILHQACNMALGHLGDGAAGLAKALAYLQSPAESTIDEHW